MLKPNLVKRKPIIRPYEVVTVYKKFLKRYLVIATSADHAVQSIALEENEMVVEAKEMVDYELVIAK